jgi:hypothetical protein
MGKWSQLVGESQPRSLDLAGVRQDEYHRVMAYLGRKGGKRGGEARARNLTKEQLSAIGKLGALARWAK